MQWMLEFLTRCWIHQDLCLVIRTNEACWRRLDGFVRQLHWTEDFWQLLAYFCYRAQNFWVLFGIPVLQSVPANKHIEVNAKPSICLFLLKSEPWDKHIYAYSWIFHFEVFGHRKLCQQICWRSTFLTEEDDKSACQRSVLFALVPLHMYRRRVKFRSMVCGCSLYEV